MSDERTPAQQQELDRQAEAHRARKLRAAQYVERNGVPADEEFRQRIVNWIDRGGDDPLPPEAPLRQAK